MWSWVGLGRKKDIENVKNTVIAKKKRFSFSAKKFSPNSETQ